MEMFGMPCNQAQARVRGVKLILVLTDYNPEYGGLGQYVRWSQRLAKDIPVCVEHFYTDPCCHGMFETFCRAVVERVNSYTGVMCRDEPAIMAWEICNEPRCKRSSGVPSGAMHVWTSKVAAHLHRLDPNHLVTVGTEGFFGPSSPGLLSMNPYDGCQDEGCDFVHTLSDPGIDFASFHLHPDHWLPLHTSAADVASFVRHWVHSHFTTARDAGKPLVLTEFGSRRHVCSKWAGCNMEVQKGSDEGTYGKHAAQAEANCMERADLYEQVMSMCAPTAKGPGQQIAGAYFWMLAAPTYPDYDGFTVYCPPNKQEQQKGLASGLSHPWVPDDCRAVTEKVQWWSRKSINQTMPVDAEVPKEAHF